MANWKRDTPGCPCCGDCSTYPDEIWVVIEGDIATADYDPGPDGDTLHTPGLFEPLLDTPFKLTLYGLNPPRWQSASGTVVICSPTPHPSEYLDACGGDIIYGFPLGEIHSNPLNEMTLYYPLVGGILGTIYYPADAHSCHCGVPTGVSRSVTISDYTAPVLDPIDCPWNDIHQYDGEVGEWIDINVITCLRGAYFLAGSPGDYDDCSKVRLVNIPYEDLQLVFCPGLISLSATCQGGELFLNVNLLYKYYFISGSTLCPITDGIDYGTAAPISTAAGILKYDCETDFCCEATETEIEDCSDFLTGDAYGGPRIERLSGDENSFVAGTYHQPIIGGIETFYPAFQVGLSFRGKEQTINPNPFVGANVLHAWICVFGPFLNSGPAYCQRYEAENLDINGNPTLDTLITSYSVAYHVRPGYTYRTWTGPNPAIAGGPNDDVILTANFNANSDLEVVPSLWLTCKLENFTATVYFSDPS